MNLKYFDPLSAAAIFALAAASLAACGTQDEAARSEAQPLKRAVFPTAFGPLELPYLEIEPGLALTMGDAIFHLPANDGARTEGIDTTGAGLAAYGNYPLWPDGVVPYVVDASLADRSGLDAAIAQYHAQTNVRFIPRTTETKYIVVRDDGSGGCNAHVGYPGFWNVHYVQLSPPCQPSLRSATHELGHVIGLLHEHQRADRDAFVVVHPQNIDPAYLSAFDKVSTFIPLNAYDSGSVMHYSSNAFSINSAATITTPSGGWIQAGASLSTADRDGINRLYTVDSTPPTVAIVSPASGTYSTSAYAQTITVTGADNHLLNRLSANVNFGPWQDAYATGQASFIFNLPANQLSFVNASAFDARGNTSAKQIRISTISDTTPPVATIALDGTFNHNGTTVQRVRVSGTDNVWVERLELWVNGNLHGSATAVGETFFNVNLTGGAFNMVGRAYDLWPNSALSETLTVQTPPPPCPPGYKFCSRCCVPQGRNCSDERNGCTGVAN